MRDQELTAIREDQQTKADFPRHMHKYIPWTIDDMNTEQNNVLSLDAERDRRRYITIANADHDWLQVKASFALEGIDMDDDDAERAGRILAGVVTTEEAIEEIRQKYARRK